MAFGKNKNKVSFEKSQVAERHGLRISSPNGYYPEDVDRELLSLEDQVAQLTRDNERLIKAAEAARNDLSALQAEFGRFRLEMMRAPVQETSYEQDIQNISKIQNITNQKMEDEVEIAVDLGTTGDLEVVGVVETENTDNKKQDSAIMETGELDLLGL